VVAEQKLQLTENIAGAASRMGNQAWLNSSASLCGLLKIQNSRKKKFLIEEG
jgi:hypothetical protein